MIILQSLDSSKSEQLSDESMRLNYEENPWKGSIMDLHHHQLGSQTLFYTDKEDINQT